MAYLLRRYLIIAVVIGLTWYLLFDLRSLDRLPNSLDSAFHRTHAEQTPLGPVQWANLKQRYPVRSFTPLPSPKTDDEHPKIQHDFGPESSEAKALRAQRREAIKDAFIHTWNGYREYAWLQDEVSPVSGEARNPFGGWGATLVDTLDTLWIMGMKKEFEEAVKAVDSIDFSDCTEDIINVFETTIRYLGGLLGAYDISKHQYPSLLKKAVEVGEMLYVAFDTPNRMPVARWDWKHAAIGGAQSASTYTLLAELGSLSLEFTRLSQLTSDPKYYDAINRITKALASQQQSTLLPGLWPIVLDAQSITFTSETGFSIGGMADSTYEYLPKQHQLLRGAIPDYKNLYARALPAIKEHILWQPMVPTDSTSKSSPLLIPGTAHYNRATSAVQSEPQFQHLGCFAAGMLALGARLFNSEKSAISSVSTDEDPDIRAARAILDGCLWSYNATHPGIAPEIFVGLPCPESSSDSKATFPPSERCSWNESAWLEQVAANSPPTPNESDKQRGQRIVNAYNLPPGMVSVPDGRYILRPETIESVFLLYRITGDVSLLEEGWKLWESVVSATRTNVAFAAIENVMVGENEDVRLADRMESFWTAETIKYFYLLYEDTDVLKLDDWVLNTEAHPLKVDKRT